MAVVFVCVPNILLLTLSLIEISKSLSKISVRLLVVVELCLESIIFEGVFRRHHFLKVGRLLRRISLNKLFDFLLKLCLLFIDYNFAILGALLADLALMDSRRSAIYCWRIVSPLIIDRWSIRWLIYSTFLEDCQFEHFLFEIILLIVIISNFWVCIWCFFFMTFSRFTTWRRLQFVIKLGILDL